MVMHLLAYRLVNNLYLRSEVDRDYKPCIQMQDSSAGVCRSTIYQSRLEMSNCSASYDLWFHLGYSHAGADTPINLQHLTKGRRSKTVLPEQEQALAQPTVTQASRSDAPSQDRNTRGITSPPAAQLNICCLSKQNTLSNYTRRKHNNQYSQCRLLLIYYLSNIQRQFRAAGNRAANLLIIAENDLLQLFFLKTTIRKYIYPLSCMFLIYAIPTGRGGGGISNMMTNCHPPPLQRGRPGLLARAIISYHEDKQIIFTAVSKQGSLL